MVGTAAITILIVFAGSMLLAFVFAWVIVGDILSSIKEDSKKIHDASRIMVRTATDIQCENGELKAKNVKLQYENETLLHKNATFEDRLQQLEKHGKR